MNVKNLFKNLFHLTEEAEQNANEYTDEKVRENTNTATTAMGLRKIGKVVELRFFGKLSSEVKAFTLPTEYRPPYSLSFPITVVYNGNCYQAYMTISANGVISPYYFNYGQADQTPISGAGIYATCVYLIGGVTKLLTYLSSLHRKAVMA